MNDDNLDEQIRYLRERLQWLDGRFGWSSTLAIAVILFASVNAHPISMPSVVHHTSDYVVYVVMAALGFVLAGTALFCCGLGMCEGFAPWRERTRKEVGCTNYFWSKNVAQYDSADKFAQAFTRGADIDPVDQQCRELWRLSKMVNDRESFLFYSRLLSFLGCVALAFSIWMLIGFWPHVVVPHLNL